MKFFFRVLSIIAFLNFLQNCMPRKMATQDLYRQWMLVEYKNYSKEDLVNQHAYIDLSSRKAPANHYNAEMGCNKLFFSAKFGNKTVKITDLGSTTKDCGDMALEQDFLRDFSNFKYYALDGQYLRLYDAEGHAITFVAADWD